MKIYWCRGKAKSETTRIIIFIIILHFLVKMSIFCLLQNWRSRSFSTLMKLSCTFARMIPLTDMVNSMVQVIRVQNPYRHSTRENEWQNCGKKFDFKSLKWRIISLVQPFLSVFFFFAISSFRILQKIITKWSYRYFLWLLICRQKKSWIITAKWVITTFKRQLVNHPKKVVKKFYLTVKM